MSIRTDGIRAVMHNTCFVAGPIAGVSADLMVLNVTAGSPIPGWSVGLINKAAIPVVGGYTISASYGSDGLAVQCGRSFGAIYGSAAKLCVQTKMSGCSP